MYNTVLFSLVSSQFFFKLITFRMRMLNDIWNILDIIYLTLAWCIYDYPYISVFRLVYNFKIVRLFRIIRSFSTLRQGLYRFTFVMMQFYKEFTIRGTAFWIFILTYLVTHMYAISCKLMFQDKLPELYGTYKKSMVTLFKLSTSQDWVDVELTMDTYGDNYLFFFLSYYIINMMGFLNGLVGIFGNAFTNTDIFEEMIEVEEMEHEKNKLKKLSKEEYYNNKTLDNCDENFNYNNNDIILRENYIERNNSILQERSSMSGGRSSICKGKQKDIDIIVDRLNIIQLAIENISKKLNIT